jgi:hypothetical protein
MRADAGLKTPLILLLTLEERMVDLWGREAGATFSMSKPSRPEHHRQHHPVDAGLEARPAGRVSRNRPPNRDTPTKETTAPASGALHAQNPQTFAGSAPSSDLGASLHHPLRHVVLLEGRAEPPRLS